MPVDIPIGNFASDYKSALDAMLTNINHAYANCPVKRATHYRSDNEISVQANISSSKTNVCIALTGQQSALFARTLVTALQAGDVVKKEDIHVSESNYAGRPGRHINFSFDTLLDDGVSSRRPTVIQKTKVLAEMIHKQSKQLTTLFTTILDAESLYATKPNIHLRPQVIVDRKPGSAFNFLLKFDTNGDELIDQAKAMADGNPNIAIAPTQRVKGDWSIAALNPSGNETIRAIISAVMETRSLSETASGTQLARQFTRP